MKRRANRKRRKDCKNELGKRFDHLLVIGITSRDTTTTNALWKCLCDCGKTVIIAGSALRNRPSKSCGCLHRLPSGIAASNRVISQYLRDAKKRRLPFSLTKEQARKIMLSNCHYCDQKPALVSSYKDMNGPFIRNGIDRKNNLQGYTVENSVPCCKICNGAKSNLSYKDFISWIKRISEFWK